MSTRISFEQPASTLAPALTGRIVRFGESEAVIDQLDVFLPENITGGRYKDLFDLPPGAVWCINMRGHILTMIVAADHGCVQIRGLKVGGKSIKGPGRCSKHLGLSTHRTQGEVAWEDDVLVITNIRIRPSEA